MGYSSLLHMDRVELRKIFFFSLVYFSSLHNTEEKGDDHK